MKNANCTFLHSLAGIETKGSSGKLGAVGVSLKVASHHCPLFPVSNQELSQRKRKRGDSGEQVEGDADWMKKKKQSQRPNYFISIPITNTEVNTIVYYSLKV